MNIKLTNYQVLSIYEILTRITFNNQLNGLLSLKISEINSELESTYKNITEKRKEYIDKYVEKNEDGNPIINNDGSVKFLKEHEDKEEELLDILNQDREFNVPYLLSTEDIQEFKLYAGEINFLKLILEGFHDKKQKDKKENVKK